jgi:hypothetical protein
MPRAEDEQDFFRRDGYGLAVVLERNGFALTVAPCIGQFCIREHFDAFATKDFLDFHRGIGVKLAQDVLAALEERNGDAEPARRTAPTPPPPHRRRG